MPGMPGPHDTADSIDTMYEQAAVDSGFCATRSYNTFNYTTRLTFNLSLIKYSYKSKEPSAMQW